MGTLANITLPPFMELFPLVVMSLTVGLFEAIFFRGGIQPRREKAFDPIPAIPIAAASYALYHVGYGMTSSEMWFLFLLGIEFAIAFRVTRNILVLWPLYVAWWSLHQHLWRAEIALRSNIRVHQPLSMNANIHRNRPLETETEKGFMTVLDRTR